MSNIYLFCAYFLLCCANTKLPKYGQKMAGLKFTQWSGLCVIPTKEGWLDFTQIWQLGCILTQGGGLGVKLTNDVWNKKNKEIKVRKFKTNHEKGRAFKELFSTVKTKCEELQIKFGVDADFGLFIRDNGRIQKPSHPQRWLEKWLPTQQEALVGCFMVMASNMIRTLSIFMRFLFIFKSNQKSVK